MTGAATVAACLWLLALWVYARETDRRRAVIDCTHEDLEVRQTSVDFGRVLYLSCKCGHQAHLTDLKPLPDGSYHLVRGENDTEKVTGWAAARARQLDWISRDAKK